MVFNWNPPCLWAPSQIQYSAGWSTNGVEKTDLLIFLNSFNLQCFRVQTQILLDFLSFAAKMFHQHWWLFRLWLLERRFVQKEERIKRCWCSNHLGPQAHYTLQCCHPLRMKFRINYLVSCDVRFGSGSSQVKFFKMSHSDGAAHWTSSKQFRQAVTWQ